MNADTFIPIALAWLDGASSQLAAGIIRPEVAAILAVLAAACFLWGIYSMTRPSRLRKRLDSYVSAGREARRVELVPQAGSSPVIVDMIERSFARRRIGASLRNQLLRAGLSITGAEFVVLCFASGMLCGALAASLFAFRIGPLALLPASLVAMAGGYLPRVIVAALGSRRMAALEEQLPDALDIVASSLKAGTGLSQGLELLAREIPPPVSDEIRLVLQELQLGLSMTEALSSMSNRIMSEELDLVVTSIAIQLRVGGNLAHVLHAISNTIRERMELRGEIRVLTAQQRISATVIGLLPMGLAAGLWLLTPDYMNGLLATDITRLMLLAAIAMQGAGLFLVNRITRIDI